MPEIAAAVVTAIAYVGSATTAVVAGTATLAQIATVAAVGIGAGVGSMAAAKALTPEIGSQGAAVRWEANPDAPLRFAFGRVGVKGNIVDAAIYGPDRMYVSFACTVSAGGPIKSFVSFRAGDYYMSFDGAGAATNEPYRGEMWLSTRLGAQPDTALSLPSGLKNGSSFPGWNASRKMSGTAGYLVTLGENSKRSAYEGKIPAFIATIEGLFCYDPRQDSSYPGGAGSCRLNDPSTWVWTQNPILFGLKWALGLWEGPTGKGAPQVDYQVGGIGAKVESIRLTTVVEAANIADANGWTSAAWPSTDDDKAQVLDGFLKAGGARYAEIAGQIAFIHRAAPRAPVFTVRARDTAGPVEIDTASSKLNRFNTVRPRFWSEANEWEMTALPEVTATEWQIEDGQGVAVKRTRGADYTFVVDPKQARELASLEISNSREGIRGRVPLRPYMDPEPGNTFIFDEPDFALANLKCFVLDVEDDTENDTVVVTFETETDGKYPYAYGQTGSPPPAQELDPVDPFFVTPPGAGDWTVTPRPPSPGGGQLPGFDISGVVGNDTATAIIVEFGTSATGPWKQAYQGPPTVTNIPLDGLQPGVQYWIAIQYQRNQNYSDRHVYGPYMAPLLDPSPSAPTIVALQGQVTDAFGDIFDVSTLLSQIRTELNAVDAALLGAIEDTNTSLGQASATLLAADEALSQAIGAVGDRAQVLEETTASLEENKASVSALNAQIARIDGVEAVNATQALALVDLENAKVALSEYNTLKGEVTAARDGAPSLLGQIQNLKTVDLDLQNNKASVASVDALTARAATTEADIIDLENALATEAGARAEAISQVAARQAINQNLMPNGSGENGPVGWSGPGLQAVNVPALGGTLIKFALAGSYVENYASSPRAKVSGGQTVTLQWKGVVEGTFSGSLQIYIAFLKADGSYAGEGARKAVTDPTPVLTSTAPSDAAFAILSLFINGNAGAGVNILLSRCKIEAGSVATIYSNDATAAALSASVTEQSLAIIDLENAKVALSEYNTLKGEVTAARDGAPSLLGQIQNLKTVDLDLQNNKASVASVDALTARAATTEADIIDLENALATEAGARAEAISQVAARQAINQNLMPNGSGENGPVGWSGPGLQAVNVPALGGTLIKFALAGSYVENYASSPRAKVSGGQTVTLQWKGVVEGTFSGSLQIYIAFLKADGSYAGEGARKAVTDPTPVLTSTAPSDAAFAILSLFINGNAGAGVNILLSRCKIEAGSVATIYSNDATAAALSASVTEQSLAIIDLELQRSLAAYQVEALASGGLPSFLSLISSTLGGYAALAAPVVALLNTISGGAPLVALEAKNGEVFFGRPIYIAMPGTGYHLIVGGGGPSGSQWLLWFGPNSINASTATRTNGALALGTDGLPYVGSAPLGDGLIVNASPLDVGGSRVGGGVATSDPTSLSVTGGLTGASIRWSNVGGDATVYANSPNSGTTTFSATLAVGQLKSAFMEAKVVKSGKVSSVVVGVTLYEESYVPPES